jgi:hypothetical protein
MIYKFECGNINESGILKINLILIVIKMQLLTSQMLVFLRVKSYNLIFQRFRWAKKDLYHTQSDPGGMSEPSV